MKGLVAELRKIRKNRRHLSAERAVWLRCVGPEQEQPEGDQSSDSLIRCK
jgi:hypothetical protein